MRIVIYHRMLTRGGAFGMDVSGSCRDEVGGERGSGAVFVPLRTFLSGRRAGGVAVAPRGRKGGDGGCAEQTSLAPAWHLHGPWDLVQERGRTRTDEDEGEQTEPSQVLTIRRRNEPSPRNSTQVQATSGKKKKRKHAPPGANETSRAPSGRTCGRPVTRAPTRLEGAPGRRGRRRSGSGRVRLQGNGPTVACRWAANLICLQIWWVGFWF